MTCSTYFIQICDKKWKVKLQRPPSPNDVGMCDYSTRTLWVTPGAQQDTILRHEVLHARLPDFDEDAILSIEQALYDADAGLRKIGSP